MTRSATLMFMLALTGCGGQGPAPGAPPAARPPDVNASPPDGTAAVGTPVVPPARLPIGRGGFGTASPTVVRGIDPSERWMALCQAREDTDGDGTIAIHVGHHGDVRGDTMTPYLVLGGGAGTPIDYFVGHSDDGRFVAVIRGAELQLVDTTTGAYRVMTGADVESDGRPGMRHRAAVFAQDRLIFIRTADRTNDRLVVYDPSTGNERELPVTGRAWRMTPESPRWLAVHTVAIGEELPRLRTTLAPGECLGPPMSYSSYGNEGATPTQRWVDLTTGAETTSADPSVAIGAELVRTPTNGGIFLERDQIAPTTCQAMIMSVLENPARVVAQCTQGKKKKKVWLFGRALARELEVVTGDGFYSDYTRMLKAGTGVVCDAGLFCIDVRTNERIDLQDGVAEYVFGDWIYVVHAKIGSRKFEVIDVASGRRTKLPTKDLRRAAGKYVLDNAMNLIDLEQATVVGTFATVPDERVISISPQGRLLAAATDDGNGPYQWTSR